MELLKHNNFVFGHILRGGYIIKEDAPDIINTTTMANGAIRNNYGNMPKTTIKVKFSQLNKETYQEYMSHFSQNEDVYSYFSPRNQQLLTKKFFVVFPENTMLFCNEEEQKYEEFEVELNQVDVVEEE